MKIKKIQLQVVMCVSQLVVGNNTSTFSESIGKMIIIIIFLSKTRKEGNVFYLPSCWSPRFGAGLGARPNVTGNRLAVITAIEGTMRTDEAIKAQVDLKTPLH